MSRRIQIILLIVTVLLIVIIVPIVTPVPPLTEIQPVEQLKYPDSQFEEVEGESIHFRQSGSGEPLILLLHGFGASTYSWDKTRGRFSQYGTVVAFDRPAFGLSERPILTGKETTNPYSSSFQLEIINYFRSKYQSNKVILVGNSAGGNLAIQYALLNPDNVAGLILVDPAIYGHSGAPVWVKPFLNTWLANKWGPYFVRSIQDRGLELLKIAWSDETRITDGDLENYQLPLKVDNWDIGLWEFTKINSQNEIEERLSALGVPVLIISGADDRVIPPENSRRAADEIAGAEYFELSGCGHVPQEECPERFFEVLQPFLDRLLK